MNRTRLALLVGALALASTASAQDFPGSYELEGKYSNQRLTSAQVTIAPSTSAAGSLTVTRKGKYTARRWRNVPEFTWQGDGKVEKSRHEVDHAVSQDARLSRHARRCPIRMPGEVRRRADRHDLGRRQLERRHARG